MPYVRSKEKKDYREPADPASYEQFSDEGRYMIRAGNRYANNLMFTSSAQISTNHTRREAEEETSVSILTDDEILEIADKTA